MRSLIAFLLLIILFSCQRQPVEMEPKQYNVPSDVEPYVQAFREAARRRGQTLLADNLLVSFGTVQTPTACGQCTRQTGRTPRVVISTNADCWQSASSYERECLIFHELGHCLLNRDHVVNRFPKGQYVSLMNPDDVSLYAICRYPIGDDECDKRPRQGYYHEELFNPTTPAPVWGR